MTAGQHTRHVSGVSLAPAALAGLLGVMLLIGGMLGAAIGSQIGSINLGNPAAQPARTSGAVTFLPHGGLAGPSQIGESARQQAYLEFRAGERAPSVGESARQQAYLEFRAGERAPSVGESARQQAYLEFRAGERQASTPVYPRTVEDLLPKSAPTSGSVREHVGLSEKMIVGNGIPDRLYPEFPGKDEISVSGSSIAAWDPQAFHLRRNVPDDFDSGSRYGFRAR